MEEDDKGCPMIMMGVSGTVGECFFWYRPTRVVLDQRPLNGCVCVCYFIVVLDLELWTAYEAGLSWVSDN